MSSIPQSTPKTPSRWKSILKRAWPTIRILLSIALLWKATSGIDWHTLLDSEIKMEPVWLIAAALAICCAFICGGLRWGFIMRSAGFEGSLKSYIALYFAGGLINQGLPSTLGGDSYRAITATHFTNDDKLSAAKELNEELHHEVDLGHATPKLRLSFAMTLVDRLLGLARRYFGEGGFWVGFVAIVVGLLLTLVAYQLISRRTTVVKIVMPNAGGFINLIFRESHREKSVLGWFSVVGADFDVVAGSCRGF